MLHMIMYIFIYLSILFSFQDVNDICYHVHVCVIVVCLRVFVLICHAGLCFGNCL